jgi:putative hemolysin
LIPELQDLGLSETSANLLSIILITIVVAYFTLIIGELVPKRIAIVRAESVALAAASTVDRIARLFRPIIWVLSKSTDLIVRAIGINPKESREKISEEELLDLLTGHARLTEQEREIVEEVFLAGDRQVHEVMLPRTEVDFLDSNTPISQAIKTIMESGHSRYPVVKGSFDEIVGFIHIRDLLDPNLRERQVRVGDLVREALFMPGTKGLLPALTEMRAAGQHLAIVVDEYGGTDGIVTLEDIVEEFIGQIRDEYDGDEKNEVQSVRAGEYHFDGLTSLDDVLDETGIEVVDGPYETVGGFLMHQLGRIPEVGDKISQPSAEFEIESIEGKRAGKIRMIVTDHEQSKAEENLK